MSDLEELKSRARRAEAAGDYRQALESYREALERERETTDPDMMDPALRLRTADLRFRLGEPERALDAYLEASELYARQGLIPNAIAVCNKVLGVYPDHIDTHRILADLQLEIGLTADARTNLLRFLEEAAGRGRTDAALEAGRAFLEREPDQEVAVAVAETLAGEGRTDRAIEILRGVWEERTGLRQPAGRIEACARRLDPREDLSAWRPVWPPPRQERRTRGRELAGGAADAASPPRADGPPAGGAAARTAEEEPGTAAALEEPPDGSGAAGSVAADADTDGAGAGDADAGDPGPGDPSGDASVSPPNHNGARTGEMEEPVDPSPPDSGEGRPEESGEAPSGDRLARPASPEPPASAGNGAPDPERELRGGLELVEELLEVAPDRLELHRRRVRYARRLGDLGLLERALLELGEALLERGSHRGARFVFQEVREQLNPGSAAAFEGLRRLDRLEEAPDERTTTGEDGDGGEGGAAAGAPGTFGPSGPPEERPSRATGVDRRFRRRLREALSSASRELAWLHAAADSCGTGRRAPDGDGVGGGDGAGGGDGVGGPGGTPVPGPSHELLGRYLLMRDRPEEAAEHLRSALERSPGGGERSAELLYHLGRAWRRAGDPGRARECFERLAEVDADFRAAWDVVSPDGG